MSVKPDPGKDAYRWVRFQFICLDEECHAWHDDCDRNRCPGKPQQK